MRADVTSAEQKMPRMSGITSRSRTMHGAKQGVQGDSEFSDIILMDEVLPSEVTQGQHEFSPK